MFRWLNPEQFPRVPRRAVAGSSSFEEHRVPSPVPPVPRTHNGGIFANAIRFRASSGGACLAEERLDRARMTTAEFFWRAVIFISVALIPVLIWFLFDVILIVVGAILICRSATPCR